MYDYYKSLPGYLSMVANIPLVSALILLFFNWRISVLLFVLTVVLWVSSAFLHKQALNAALLETGLKKSVAKSAKKCKNPEGIADLKGKAFSDEQRKVLQEMAEGDTEKIKVKMDEFAEILAEFTEDMSRETELQYRSFIKLQQAKQGNSHSERQSIADVLEEKVSDVVSLFLTASGLERIGVEVLILNMFIITRLCLNRNFPRTLLDMYTIEMYERISPSIPEEAEIIPGIHLTREALLKAFEEHWLGNRFSAYYEAMKKNLGSESGVWEIGRTVVGNFGGDISDSGQVLAC